MRIYPIIILTAAAACGDLDYQPVDDPDWGKVWVYFEATCQIVDSCEMPYRDDGVHELKWFCKTTLIATTMYRCRFDRPEHRRVFFGPKEHHAYFAKRRKEIKTCDTKSPDCVTQEGWRAGVDAP